MRKLRYQVAASLDGYIARGNGEADWIPEEPSFDFGALYAQFDTLLMGRKTWETTQHLGLPVTGHQIVVVSTTLPESPSYTLHRDASGVADLKRQSGKDIWLFGGGQLFRTLLEAQLVDTVEVAVVPVLLGGGIPLLPAPAHTTRLRLTRSQGYPTGITLLEYTIAV